MIKELSLQLQALIFIIFSFVLISLVGVSFIVRLFLGTVALSMLDYGLQILNIPTIMQATKRFYDKFRQL